MSSVCHKTAVYKLQNNLFFSLDFLSMNNSNFFLVSFRETPCRGYSDTALCVLSVHPLINTPSSFHNSQLQTLKRKIKLLRKLMQNKKKTFTSYLNSAQGACYAEYSNNWQCISCILCTPIVLFCLCSLVYHVIPPISFFHRMGHDFFNTVTIQWWQQCLLIFTYWQCSCRCKWRVAVDSWSNIIAANENSLHDL